MEYGYARVSTREQNEERQLIALQLLSYVAQTEREFIRQRQAEGIAAAKARGELSARAAGEKLQITHSTFLLWAREKSCPENTEMKTLGGKGRGGVPCGTPPLPF